MHADRPPHRPTAAAPLPVGTRLGAFDVRAVIGRGTYGFVYRVLDPETAAEYAVKEYLPPGAIRVDGLQVAPRGAEETEAFAAGLRAFFTEGKLLSQLRHPCLVRVYGSWEENGTAYMAMDLVAGRNLHDTLRARWKPLREGTLRAMLDGLLGAIDTLHRAGLQHRDIAPPSIVVGPDGRALLMDLGTPRRLAAARGETGDTGPREGFAPIELYGRTDGLPRGPWTDFYGLGATLHYMVTGRPPPAAAARVDGAARLHWAPAVTVRHSLDLLAVVEWMLSPHPRQRPASVDAVRRALAGDGLPERLRPRWDMKLRVWMRRHRRALWVAGGLLLLGTAAVGARWLLDSPLLPWNPPAA